jgi:hypothetical protein
MVAISAGGGQGAAERQRPGARDGTTATVRETLACPAWKL